MHGATNVPASSRCAPTCMLLLQRAHDDRHDRAHAQRLVDDRRHVLALAAARRGPRRRSRRPAAGELAGVAHEALDRPRHRRRGRLVTGQQQRHELVAQFGVGHPLALRRRSPAAAARGCRCAARGPPRRAGARSRRRSAASSALSARPAAPCRALRARAETAARAAPSRRASARSARRSPACSSRIRSASTPNTARRITSSVILRVRSCTRIGRPSGQLAMSRSVAATITSSYSRIRSP